MTYPQTIASRCLHEMLDMDDDRKVLHLSDVLSALVERCAKEAETARVLYDDANDWAKQVAERIRALLGEPGKKEG